MSKRSLAKSRDKAPVTTEEPDKPSTSGTSAATSTEAPKPEQHAHRHHNRHPVKQHNYSVHRVEAHSPLSSESPEQNFRGFFNLAGIILVVNNLRLVIENLLKYGLLINMNVINHYIDWIDLSWTLTLPVFIGMSLFFERLVHKKQITEKQMNWLSMLNISSLLIIPASIIRSTNTNPASGIIVLMLTCIVWMKLVSYCVVNKENRRLHAMGQTYHEEIDGVDAKDLVTYPNNLTIKNLSYFIAAPTLCYQMNYPRSKSIRWYWLTGKFLQFIFFTSLMVFMTEQYVTPTIRNSVHMVNASRNVVWMLLERILKLSIPMLFVWLLGFYSLFHLWLNILAELLKFGDREFYKDWWNSTTLDGYWRNWNLPVHHWLLRHLYYPCMRAGINKYLAAALIFFVSAVFHEIIVSVALHTFKLWFFFGMFLQVPMIWFGRLFPQNSQMGNINFWFSFCIVGQPALVLLYYYDYYQRVFAESQH